MTTSIPHESYIAETERLDSTPYLSFEWAARQTEQTERLDTTPAYLPRNARPMQIVVALIFVTLAIGIYTRTLLFGAGFAAGWAARDLAGSMWDQRGWAALVVFAIVGSTVIVHGRNRL